MDWLAKVRNLLGRDGNKNELMALRPLADQTGISYSALRKAAQDGRLNAVKRGGSFWLATIGDVEKAVAEGKMKPLQEE